MSVSSRALARGAKGSSIGIRLLGRLCGKGSVRDISSLRIFIPKTAWGLQKLGAQR